MRQAALQFKTILRNTNILDNISFERISFNSLMTVLAGLAFLYVIILGNMVWNIVERKAMEKEAMALANEVGEMELSYLALSKSVDKNLSYQMGFKETTVTYVSATRKSLGSVKLAKNEI